MTLNLPLVEILSSNQTIKKTKKKVNLGFLNEFGFWDVKRKTKWRI